MRPPGGASQFFLILLDVGFLCIKCEKENCKIKKKNNHTSEMPGFYISRRQSRACTHGATATVNRESYTTQN